jgi:tetratricopeptide (TPR) repeat protein
MPLRLLLILFCYCCITGQAMAEPDAMMLFSQAQQKYAADEYTAALSLARKAVALQPEESRFHHLLGKCYGRIAEQANWFKAVSYARKTREAFEKAVELDHLNIAALRDLMEYYRQAPKFLGGSTDKADAIKSKLDALANPDSQG